MTPPAPGTPMRRIPQETAEWVFSYDGGHDSQEAFESCLQVLDGALDVLQRHELLAPRCVALQHWERRREGGFVVAPELPSLTVEISEQRGASALVRETSQARGGDLPLDMLVYGTTLVHDGHGGAHHMPHPALFIRVDPCSLWVSTWTDVWMRHTLLGKPQPQVHAKNAPRLEQALRDLEAFMGEAGDSDDDPPPYAIVEGYRVVNPLDRDGMPVDYSRFLVDE